MVNEHQRASNLELGVKVRLVVVLVLVLVVVALLVCSLATLPPATSDTRAREYTKDNS